jgi:hypothetical protein
LRATDDPQPSLQEPSRVRPFLPAVGTNGSHGVAGVAGATGTNGSHAAACPQREPTVSPLRPYLLTGGRAWPSAANLEIEAQVVTTGRGYRAIDTLAYEQRDIVDLCCEPMAVAEVAARLELHLGVARVLVGDLLALGHLAVRRPEPVADLEVKIIERIIRGLQSID